MKIHRLQYPAPLPSEITPQSIANSRRQFLQQLAVGAATATSLTESVWAQAAGTNKTLPAKPNLIYTAKDKPTSFTDATTYNNFYEFGLDKSDPAITAKSLKTHPWTVQIDGEIKKPLTLDIDSLLKLAPLEERLYRLRCVEGWSMVIPWVGYSFSELIRKVEPTGNAKYVEFTTLADPKQMPGVGNRVLNWPYTEGLRIDEANHPLAMLVLGMYGQTLTNQNGAPVRMILPWKYGFKSAKSLVRIRFTEKPPITAWNRSAPEEYGFYANVNPEVDHPRWSQATERRIGDDGLFNKKRATMMFNGYPEVASLYSGMNLKKFY